VGSTRTLLCFALLCCAVLCWSELILCINRLWNDFFFFFFLQKVPGMYGMCCAALYPVGTGRLAGVMYDIMV